jgi:hypothetical protein
MLRLQLAPADERATDFEECFVNAGQSFIADSEATKPMQPCDGSFHDPTRLAQTAAMLGSAPRDLRLDALRLQGCPMRVGIVGTVALDELGFAFGMARFACDRGNSLNQGKQLGDIVAIGLGQNDRERNALRVGEEVVFRTGTTAIGRVRSRFFPAPKARMEELSATAREKSMRSAWRSLESSTWCNRSHTLARCHALSRRQQVLPDPQPISRGSIFQGIPERSTNTIPVSAARSVTTGKRPGLCLRRRLGRGRSGSTMLHNSSSISGFDIAPLRGKQCRS